MALLCLALFVMGCGARTSLREERLTTAMPDWSVQTVCQCGNCKTVPWCSDPNGGWLCDLGDPSCICVGDPLRIQIDRALSVTDRNGTAATLYCHGPVTLATDNLPTLIAWGGRTSDLYVPQSAFCSLSNQAIAQVVAGPIPPSFSRSITCGTNPRYFCDTITSGVGIGPNYAFANELLCPKASPLSDPRIIVPGADSTAALSNARPILGAMCAMWSAPFHIGVDYPGVGGLSPLPPATPTPPAFHCFARRGSQEQVFANAGLARTFAGAVVTDPGHDIGGEDLFAHPNSHLVITRLSDGATATVSLGGTGAASVDPNGLGLSVTDFQLQQIGTTSLGGYTVSNTRINLEDLWSGSPSGTPNQYTLAADDTRVQGQYTFSGSTYSMRLTAIQPGTARWHGSWFELDSLYESDDIGVRYALHIELDPVRARPTASVTPLTTPEVECTSPAGALVNFTGSATGSSGNVRTAWSLHTEYDVFTTPGGTSSSFQVPLEWPWSDPLHAQLTVFDGLLTARATTPVRVIDSVAPTLHSRWVDVDCGWGGVADNHNPPKYCVRVVGSTSDTCSSSQVATQWVTQFLGCDRNNILQEDAKSCIRPQPGHWGNDIGNIVYEAWYAPQDAWGNLGTSTRVSFKIQPAASEPNCSEPRTVVIDPCGWGW